MFWSLAEILGMQAVQFLISIILARLLLPEQFGLIGMLTLFIALAQSLMDSGFGSALIQKKDASHLDTCSVFYFNLLLGIALTALLYGTAPLIGGFYEEPLLVPLTRFLSLNIFINAFGLVPSVMLTKRMDFKALLKVSLISVVISGAIGVSMAVKGLGVWSLAVQSVLATLLRAVLLWLVSHWCPSWNFSWSSLKTMFSYGSRLLLSGLLDTFFYNIYQPLIGKLYSAADVGYYVRAQSLQAAAIQPAGSALGRVIFPALTQIQNDPARLKQAVRKAMTMAVFFNFPLMVGLIVVAEPLIILLMTDRWAPSVPYFQLFCVLGLLYPQHVINLSILKVIGRSDLFFRLEVAKKALIILAIAITYKSGITALLWGQVATSIVAYLLNSYFTKRFIGYSIGQQIQDGIPYLLISLLTGASMHLVGFLFNLNLPILLIQTLTGTLVYLALNYVFRKPMLTEIINIAKQVLLSLPAAI